MPALAPQGRGLVWLFLVCAFFNPVYAADYNVTPSGIEEVTYSHASKYNGQAWYKATDTATGQNRYFRRPVTLDVSNQYPTKNVPDLRNAVKSGSSIAAKAARLNSLSIALLVASEGAGWVIDELTGQVTTQPVTAPDSTHHSGYYYCIFSSPCFGAASGALAWAEAGYNDPVAMENSYPHPQFGVPVYRVYYTSNNATLFEVQPRSCAGSTTGVCDPSHAELTTPGDPVVEMDLADVINSSWDAATESEKNRVFTDLNGDLYNFPEVVAGAESVVSQLQSEGHTATAPASSSPQVTDNDMGDRVSVNSGSGEYDPNSPSANASVTVNFPDQMKIDESGTPTPPADGANNYDGSGWDLLNNGIGALPTLPSINPMPSLPSAGGTCETINIGWTEPYNIPTTSQCTQLHLMRDLLEWALYIMTAFYLITLAHRTIQNRG